jgi:uncharacterized phage protein gp47/JayE
MPTEADVIYRTKQQIVTSMVQSLMARIPDAWVEEDGNLRIFFEVIAGEHEGVYLANQLLRDNIWVQRANIPELRLHGEMYGLPIKDGLLATGLLKFQGAGGTFLPAGTEAAADLGGDSLHYFTIADGTIPSPGIPNAPTAVDAAVAGSVPAGTYTYAITFLTTNGETAIGAPSTAVTLTGSSKVNLSNIPVGGPGTLTRNIYRSLSGGPYGLVDDLPNNTTTTFQDNIAATSSAPPDTSSAEVVELEAQAEEAGAIYNVGIGTVTVMVNTPSGVASVVNSTAFTGGTDEEAMEVYRARLLDFIRAPRTGSATDLRIWAEEIDGVDSATVFENDNLGTPTNGHSTVRIAGPNGSIPSSTVQTEVLNALNEKDIANMTIHVATFTPLAVNVTVSITVASGYVLASVSPSINLAIQNYINSVGVGGTVYVAGIYDAVYGLPGVTTLVVSAPTAPGVSASATQKPVPGTITIS